MEEAAMKGGPPTPSRVTRHASRLPAFVALCLAAWGLAGCSRPRPGGAPASTWRPGEFLIALRGAPPAKLEHYTPVAQASFNAIAGNVGPDALSLARRCGLKLIMGGTGLDAHTLSDRAGRRRVAGLLARFRDDPALWGYYYMAGEPREADLDAVAQVADFAREHDPAHPLFVTLLPSDAWVGPALATADYTGYLESFAAKVRPALLSHANFPFREKGDTGFYFENLEAVRRTALAHGLPFYPTLRGAVWSGMRRPTEGELRWLAYTSLAYGAKGVVWFGYWGAPGGGRDGIVQPDGLLTERYRWIATLNAELRALGPTLMRLRSTAVHHTGEVPVGGSRLPVHGLVGSAEGGSFVVGEFLDCREPLGEYFPVAAVAAVDVVIDTEEKGLADGGGLLSD